MSIRRFSPFVVILFLALPYAAFVASVVPWKPENPLQSVATILVLTLGFVGLGFWSYRHTLFLWARYASDLNDLDFADAWGFTMRLLFGLREYPPKLPTLMVQAGQAAAEGPEVLHKAGGPGHLSVAPGNAVVTSRLGMLNRVLFPGFHNLGPFERIWDVLDLRPQRRTITVEFMTRDGILASTVVNVVCRPALPQLIRNDLATDAHQKIVLGLTTSKFVRRSTGSERLSDWIIGIVNGAVDGAARDILEEYALDDFVNPQNWLVGAELPPRIGAVPVKLPELEARILSKVSQTGKERGIVVEKIELGPVHPSQEAITRQWLDFWKARLQRDVDDYVTDVEAQHTQQLVDVQIALQVDFIKRTLVSVENLTQGQKTAPIELIYDSIMQVVLSMYEGSPEVQHMLFQQGESLVRFVEMILHGPSMVVANTPGVQRGLRSGGQYGGSGSPAGTPGSPAGTPGSPAGTPGSPARTLGPPAITPVPNLDPAAASASAGPPHRGPNSPPDLPGPAANTAGPAEAAPRATLSSPDPALPLSGTPPLEGSLPLDHQEKP
jgi:hypothetical protein